MPDETDSDDIAEQPSATDATEQSQLPANFQTDGERIIEGLQQLIEGMPILTVCSALSATLFAAATGDNLDRPAREALSVMVNDMAMNVLAANEISEERLQVIMAQRGGVAVMASEQGSVLLDAADPDQEQG